MMGTQKINGLRDERTYSPLVLLYSLFILFDEGHFLLSFLQGQVNIPKKKKKNHKKFKLISTLLQYNVVKCILRFPKILAPPTNLCVINTKSTSYNQDGDINCQISINTGNKFTQEYRIKDYFFQHPRSHSHTASFILFINL